MQDQAESHLPLIIPVATPVEPDQDSNDDPLVTLPVISAATSSTMYTKLLQHSNAHSQSEAETGARLAHTLSVGIQSDRIKGVIAVVEQSGAALFNAHPDLIALATCYRRADLLLLFYRHEVDLNSAMVVGHDVHKSYRGLTLLEVIAYHGDCDSFNVFLIESNFSAITDSQWVNAFYLSCISRVDGDGKSLMMRCIYQLYRETRSSDFPHHLMGQSRFSDIVKQFLKVDDSDSLSVLITIGMDLRELSTAPDYYDSVVVEAASVGSLHCLQVLATHGMRMDNALQSESEVPEHENASLGCA